VETNAPITMTRKPSFCNEDGVAYRVAEDDGITLTPVGASNAGLTSGSSNEAADEVTDDFFDNFEASTNKEESHDVLDSSHPHSFHPLSVPDGRNTAMGGDVFCPLSGAGGSATLASTPAPFPAPFTIPVPCGFANGNGANSRCIGHLFYDKTVHYAKSYMPLSCL